MYSYPLDDRSVCVILLNVLKWFYPIEMDSATSNRTDAKFCQMLPIAEKMKKNIFNFAYCTRYEQSITSKSGNLKNI